MSALEAIRAKGLADLAALLRAELAQRGWSTTELARRAFGVNDKGKVSNQTYTSTLVAGRLNSTPRYTTLVKLAAALELPVDTLTDVLHRPAQAVPAPVRAQEFKREPRPHMPPEDAVPFLLAINADGSATLRIDMRGVAPDKAFRVMGALTAAGLLPTGVEPPLPPVS